MATRNRNVLVGALVAAMVIILAIVAWAKHNDNDDGYNNNQETTQNPNTDQNTQSSDQNSDQTANEQTTNSGTANFSETLANGMKFAQLIPSYATAKTVTSEQDNAKAYPKPELTVQYSLKNQTGSDVSNLMVYDITQWLNSDTAYNRFGDNATVTAKQKNDYFNMLSNLNSQSVKSLKQCGFGFFETTCYGKRMDFVQTSDGTFKGWVNLEVSHQSFEYFPYSNFQMVGTVNGKKYFITGTYQINDQAKAKLGNGSASNADITAAINKLSGTLPTDTQSLYNDIMNSLRSITISK